MKVTQIRCNHCGTVLTYPYEDDYIDVSINLPGGETFKGDLCGKCEETFRQICNQFFSAYQKELEGSDSGMDVLLDGEYYEEED